MSDQGINRKMVRVIYPSIDWDEYDREVIAESLPDYEAAVEALRVIQSSEGGQCRRTDPDYGTCFAPHDYKEPSRPQEPDPTNEWCHWCIAESVLRRLREGEAASVR